MIRTKERKILFVLGLLVFTATSGLIQAYWTPSLSSTTPDPVYDGTVPAYSLNQMNGWFTREDGQSRDQMISFIYRSGDTSVAFTDRGYVVKLKSEKGGSDLLVVTFLGARPVYPEGREELGHSSNFFIGNDPARWRTGVPNYAEIIYSGIYKGIDLVFRSSDTGLKYEFIVSPGASPSVIRLGYEGAHSLDTDSMGDLHIITPGAELVEQAPFTYQEIDGIVYRIESTYQVEEYHISFNLGEYDLNVPLIIDPLIYSTYLGGRSLDNEPDIAVDADGHAYIAGQTASSDFPISDECYDSESDGWDFFVCKFAPSGSELLYSTFIGGSDPDWCSAIVIDEFGNAYVTGDTESPDFPTTSGSYQEIYGGGDYEGVVLKLNHNGTELLYSTFLGGSENDRLNDIVIDEGKNCYVTGYTMSEDYPTTDGCYDDIHEEGEVIVTVLDTSGSSLVYSTFLGGGNGDEAEALVPDEENRIYLTGQSSGDFPTTHGSFDSTFNDKRDGFVSVLSADGTNLLYSTYLGGSEFDYCYDIALDLEGSILITGATSSGDFPTTPGSYDGSYNEGDYDSIITKMTADCSQLLYSTFIGGEEGEKSYDITVDSENYPWIIGITESEDFPTTMGAFNEEYNGGSFLVEGDIFVTILEKDGSDLVYSSYIGGSEHDGSMLEKHHCAMGSNDTLYVAGVTVCEDFPTTPGCFDSSHNGGTDDIFVFQFDPDLPRATIDTITPSPGTEGEDIRFYGNGSDDDGITGYEWWSNIDGFLGTGRAYNSTELSPGSHMISFRVMNSSGAWSKRAEKQLNVGWLPTASILRIQPHAADEGDPVWFHGKGTDRGGTIQGYHWWSSIDGLLGSQSSIQITSLSNGTHTIFYSVQNSSGYWSQDVSEQISINGIPRANLMELDTHLFREGERVRFSGRGSDDGEIEGYAWYSNIDGFLSDEVIFSLSNLTNGTHTIKLSVRDDWGSWSENVSTEIIVNGIPRVRIVDITPTVAKEGERISFAGYGIDDGVIEEYDWHSSIDGTFSTAESFHSSDFSNGTHMISLKVRDDHGVWSEVDEMTLKINGLPRVEEVTFSPDNPVVDESIAISVSGHDDGVIARYACRSSKDGELYNGKSGTFCITLSPGEHEINLRVQDDDGVWSQEIVRVLVVEENQDNMHRYLFLTFIVGAIGIVLYLRVIRHQEEEVVAEAKGAIGEEMELNLDPSSYQQGDDAVGTDTTNHDDNTHRIADASRCPTCSFEMSFLPPVKKWYCPHCKEFGWPES